MNPRNSIVFLALVVAACGSSGVPSGTASAGLKAEGPALQVPVEMLEKALSCTSDVSGATRDPVLIVPAFSTAEESFGGYLRQLPTLGIPTCSITLPDRGYADLQNAVEYIVYAIRKINAQSGRKLILFGHQHGPLDHLWALTFWPDLPGKVTSLISLATPFQGTESATTFCNAASCSPSVWQIASGSQFVGALLAHGLPKDVAITSISTQFDEVIIPQPDVSGRAGVTQIVLQDICAGRQVEHFTILQDNLTYELVLDAINHPGQPANPAHLPADICNGPRNMPSPAADNSQPGNDPGAATDTFFVQFPLNNTTQSVSAEPPLRDYAKPPQ